MVAKDCHIGNKMNVGYEFPCPACGRKASGDFNKAGKVGNGNVQITAACEKCGEIYNGTALLDETGSNVDVHFDDERINASQLKVWGY